MRAEQTFERLELLLEEYDLLHHPFYEAWSAGELTQTDLREYAAEYYHHVAAFPTYLSALHSQLPDGALRRTVLRNLYDEEIDGVPHSELWLDFAEGVGANRESIKARTPLPHVRELILTFRNLMGSPASGLAACYAYESQVPRIAREKARTLRVHYGADARTCRYFELHRLVDRHHSNVWKRELETLLSTDVGFTDDAMCGAGEAAEALWHAMQVRRSRCRMSSLRETEKSSLASESPVSRSGSRRRSDEKFMFGSVAVQARSTMKALRKTRAGTGLSLETVPVPVVGPRDVLVRVKIASICGTDLHIYGWDRWSQYRIKPPVTLGHEFCGTVAEADNRIAQFALFVETRDLEIERTQDTHRMIQAPRAPNKADTVPHGVANRQPILGDESGIGGLTLIAPVGNVGEVEFLLAGNMFRGGRACPCSPNEAFE